MWYIHTMEYYLVIKKNDVLVHAKAWMNLKNIMISERSQTQKTPHIVQLHLYEKSGHQIN